MDGKKVKHVRNTWRKNQIFNILHFTKTFLSPKQIVYWLHIHPSIQPNLINILIKKWHFCSKTVTGFHVNVRVSVWKVKYCQKTFTLTKKLFPFMSQPLKSKHTHTPAQVTGSPQQGCQPPAGGQFNDLSRSRLY